jgi:hypothetical protein
MLINPTELSLFLYTLPKDALEGSEIIKLYEQSLSRKSIKDFIHMTLSTPLRKPINKYIHNKDEFIKTYIPHISLGRAQGHTQAILEYVTSPQCSTELTLVVYNDSHKDAFISRIEESGKKARCKIMMASEFALVSDFSLYPQVIVDCPYTMDCILQINLIPFVTHSKIIIVGS